MRYVLEWGIQQFSINLEVMPMFNFLTALEQNLVPFGKITVIKTFILSIFNYIFSSILSPPATFFSKSLQKCL